MNNQLAKDVIQQALDVGVREFCVAAGKRNAPLIYGLANLSHVKIYYWPEERSAAFFALGRVRATGLPVAVITTSGTAVGNLLPATMEAFYTQLPLLLITADRPRRQRGTGAPQCAEQVGIFSHYVDLIQDIAADEPWNLNNWTLQAPAHLNVCFEEPEEESLKNDRETFDFNPPAIKKLLASEESLQELELFLEHVNYPLVIVGALNPADQEKVAEFLLRLKAPVYAEAISGLREDSRLVNVRVVSDHFWKNSTDADYPIDGILRIGSIPTCRIWRDLEEKGGQINVCSISQLPFSGLSWNKKVLNLERVLIQLKNFSCKRHFSCEKWIEQEKIFGQHLTHLFVEEPQAEISLMHHLSQLIPQGSLIYLGNSLPIREWDQAASWRSKNLQVKASRGLCGIDGQIATFLGLCTPLQENWAIIGDLTALYDLVAPWVFQQLPEMDINLVIINNGGGQIFSHMFSNPIFLNPHDLQFKPLADLWKWHYEKWEEIPTYLPKVKGGRIIEILPNTEASKRFLQKIKK